MRDKRKQCVKITLDSCESETDRCPAGACGGSQSRAHLGHADRRPVTHHIRGNKGGAAHPAPESQHRTETYVPAQIPSKRARSMLAGLFHGAWCNF